MVTCHQKLCGMFTAKVLCLYLYILMRLTGVPISLFSKINLSKAFSTLHGMHAKSTCKWMKTHRTNHSMVPCHSKLCGKLTTQLSCLYLYILMRLAGVPVSLFSKIYFNKSFFILHHMHPNSISNWMRMNKTNKSMVPCHPKLCGKLTAQLLSLYLYMSMRPIRSSYFTLLKNKSH